MPSDAWLDNIDRLVVEKVMGWHSQGFARHWLDTDGREVVWQAEWHPTRNRGQAMEVFEQLATTEHGVMLSGAKEGYRMWIYHGISYWDVVHQSAADTPMLAICLAALQKAGVEVPGE